MNKEKLKEIVNMAIELRDKDIMVHLFKNNDLIWEREEDQNIIKNKL